MSQKSSGILYLLPAPLQPYEPGAWEPAALSQTIPAAAALLYSSLDSFIVESERTALRLLSRFKNKEGMEKLSLKILNEHSADAEIPELLQELLAGRDCGFLTEAGMPCIADPGAALVSFSHSHGVKVVPVSGPSSIILALAASGLDAQRFAFLGYLPQEKNARRASIQRMAKDIKQDGMTRIFIETPYRNEALLQDCAALLPDDLWLSVAVGLCGTEERIISMPAAQWRAKPLPKLGKIPAVFLFGQSAGLKPKNTR